MDFVLFPIAIAAAIFAWRLLAKRLSSKRAAVRYAAGFSVAAMFFLATIGTGLELEILQMELEQQEGLEAERFAIAGIEEAARIADSRQSIELADPQVLAISRLRVEARDFSVERAKEIAVGYAELNGIPTEDYDAFDRCFGAFARIGIANLPIREAMEWCLRRYANDWKVLPAEHATYDGSSAMEQFSRTNGAHMPTEAFIKAHMHEPDSYEHLETRFDIRSYDTPSRMIVSTRFKGKDLFGAIVINTVKVKVDLRTGEVLGFVG